MSAWKLVPVTPTQAMIDSTADESRIWTDAEIYSAWLAAVPDSSATGAAPTDEQINALRLKHGVTSDGRGIREVSQVFAFAREVLALYAGAPPSRPDPSA